MKLVDATEYVAGFLIDKVTNEVVLIQKKKPDWQKGKYNAVGGKIEGNESALQAMIREFKEEAGITVFHWDQFCILRGEDWNVHFFRAFASDLERKVSTQEEEEIRVMSIARLKEFPHMVNLDWLIPMALSMDEDKAVRFDVVELY